MRLFIIKLIVWLIGFGNKSLKEDSIKWLIEGLHKDVKSKVGPKTVALVNRLISGKER